MNVISRKKLTDAAADKTFESIAADLDAWYAIANSRSWKDLLEVQRDYPKAEAVRIGNDTYTVFNIRHNRFRLVVKIVYPTVVFIKYVLTHKEYERTEWKDALETGQGLRKGKKR